MRTTIFALAIGLAIAGFTAPVVADSAPEPGATPPAGTSPSVGDIVIGEIERRIIRDYYQRQLDDWERGEGGKKKKGKENKNGKQMPPGLAKRGELPPGLAKQLARNGHLPPGLDGRDLPSDLLGRLPHLDPAYRYMIADNKVMLVRRATNVILDILTVAAADILD